MKGQQAISVILLTGILVVTVSSIYFWGIPLIEKNKDIALQENAENFMRNLAERIKYVANNPGREQLRFEIDGVLRYDGDSIELDVETKGTIYEAGGFIPLGKNDCSATTGTWGSNTPETLCVRSQLIGERSYLTTYRLSFPRLDTAGADAFKIQMTGNPKQSGGSRTIILENKGISEGIEGSKNVIRSLVSFDVQS
jgi:hypothetical protein